MGLSLSTQLQEYQETFNLTMLVLLRRLCYRGERIIIFVFEHSSMRVYKMPNAT